MMGRVAEEVRDAKGDQPAPGVGPSQDLLEARRRLAAAEAGSDHLDQRHELHRPQSQAEHEHDGEPGNRTEETLGLIYPFTRFLDVGKMSRWGRSR